MTTVNASTAPATTQPASSSTAQPRTADTTSLLPPPKTDDPMAALYAVLSQQRRLGTAGSVNDLKNAQKTRRRMVEIQKEKIAKAAEEARKGGFWKKVANKSLKLASYAAVAASIAFAVGTGGAGTPVAILAITGASLSAAAFAQREFQVLEKMGVSEDWAKGIEWSLVIGGAGCTLGAGGAIMLGAEAGTASTTATTIGHAASATSGAATAAGGLAYWQSQEAEGEATHKMAEAAEAQADAARMTRLITKVLQELEDSEKSDQRTLEHLSGAMIAKGEALAFASTRV